MSAVRGIEENMKKLTKRKEKGEKEGMKLAERENEIRPFNFFSKL